MSYDNTISFSGNLARDIEVRDSKAGNVFATSAVAINMGKDKPASFMDIIIFGDLAERAGESFSKGDRVIVSGRISQDRWEDDEGNKRSKVKVIVDDIGGSVRWNTVTVHKTKKWDGPADEDLI